MSEVVDGVLEWGAAVAVGVVNEVVVGSVAVLAMVAVLVIVELRVAGVPVAEVAVAALVIMPEVVVDGMSTLPTHCSENFSAQVLLGSDTCVPTVPQSLSV